jgi:hypothetical protein
MNKDKKFAEFIVKKFPFLVNGDKSHFYKFVEADAAAKGGFRNLDLEKMTGAEFLGFLDRAGAGELKHWYKSEEAMYQKCSKKLTGNSFKENIAESHRNGQDSVVFWYSKECHACRNFGPLFETFARESHRDYNEKYSFTKPRYFRINGHLNSTPDVQNLPWTPVFSVIKQGYPNNPLILRNSMLTPKMLLDWIEISVDYAPIDRSVADGLFSQENLQLRASQDYKSLIEG